MDRSNAARIASPRVARYRQLQAARDLGAVHDNAPTFSSTLCG
jgi:hypothetical protein